MKLFEVYNKHAMLWLNHVASGTDPMRKRTKFISLALFMMAALDHPAPALADRTPHMSAKIKALIREEDSLDDRCRAPGMDANGRICLLRGHILTKLRHLGWCWGDEKIDAIEEAYHWLRCSKVRTIK